MNKHSNEPNVRWLLAGSVVAQLALGCGSVEQPSDDANDSLPEVVSRPTCADNPLLAGCSSAAPGGAGSGDEGAGDGAAPSPPSERPPSELALARAAAENVLRGSCGECHGPALTEAAARAGMNYIDDVDELVAQGKLTPLDSAGSLVVRRMRDGSMPPLSSNAPRPSSRDIDVVAEFIDEPLFWPEHDTPRTCEGQLLSFDDLYGQVQRDLRGEDSRDRPFLRYLTLTNRYNAGVCAESLERDRLALSKLVNMLSTRPRVRSPQAVDRDQLIYRVDLRDYDWDRPIVVDGVEFRDRWEAIIAGSPYAIPFVGDQADDIREDALTDVAILSFDAMLDAAAVGNLYYALIGVDVEEPLSDFVSETLGIDIDRNLREGRAVRAGTTRSQISRQDRVVERHEIEVRRGAYWQSFDFAADIANESIFANPFGFNQGGTEAIFTLPNGMLGFIIADQDDNIVAESDLLLDTFQDDFVARTSVSCSGCHSKGFNPVEDEVRPYVERNRFTLGRDNLEGVRELYPAPSEFLRIIEDDSQFFTSALERAGLPASGSDPVATTFARFNADMDLKVAAGDLGVTPDELRRNLNLLEPVLGVLRSVTIDRDDFTGVLEASLCVMQKVSRNQPDPARCAAAIAALETGRRSSLPPSTESAL